MIVNNRCPGRKKDDLVQMLQTIPAAIGAKIETVTILVRDVGKVVQTVRKRLKRAEGQKIEAAYRKKTKGWTRSEKRKVKRRANIYSQVRYALLRPRSYWHNPKDDQEKKKKKAEEYARLQQALAKSKELKKAYNLFNEFRDLLDDAQLDRAGAAVALLVPESRGPSPPRIQEPDQIFARLGGIYPELLRVCRAVHQCGRRGPEQQMQARAAARLWRE